MRSVFLIICLSISGLSFGQKRIGIDVNTHFHNLNFTTHYQQVIKGPILFSTGIFFGDYGEGGNFNDPSVIAGGFDIGAAYPSVNMTHTDTSGVHHLKSYRADGHGFGVHFGIGIYKEFRNFHGIRFNLNNRIGWMKSDIRAIYVLPGMTRGHGESFTIRHPVGGLTLELYHTVRMSGRSTFYWGVKAPYYYTLDKGRYNPKKDSEMFYKFRMDMTIGFTRAIGKCN